MQRAAAFLFVLTVVFAVGLGGQAPAEARTFLLVFDDLHLEFRSTSRLRETARRVLRALNRDGDLWALVSTGPSSISMTPTSDSAALESAIRRVFGNGLKPGDFLDARQQLDGARELRLRAAIAFSAAADAINAVAAAQESKPFTVLYFSNGYDAGLVTEPAELIQTAVRANAAIYTIDPRGLTTVAATQGVSQSDWDAYVEATRGSLSTLATRTQGMAVFTVDVLEAVLSRLAQMER